MRVECFTAGKCWPSQGGIGIYGAVIKTDGCVTWTDSGNLGRAGSTILCAKFAGAVCGLRKLAQEHVAHPEAMLALYLDDRQTVHMLNDRWTVGENDPHYRLWREARELFRPLDRHKMYFNWMNQSLAHELVAQTAQRYRIPLQESRRA
jgi:hypothetical protein